MLDISDLKVGIEGGRTILDGLDLNIPAGQVHAIMGPNGAGKSTLSNVLAGREGYEVSGRVTLDGEDLLGLAPEARAVKGLFLAFQYPIEIPGVGNSNFLRTALNAQREARGEGPVSAGEFLGVLREHLATLQMDTSFLGRAVNEGFSGGEKKRNEILQMMVLQPRFAVLDETDSGLDIDALRIVAAGIEALRNPDRSMLLITHYPRLLELVKPDRVHVLANGRIIRSGSHTLAEELEIEGYTGLTEALAR